MTTLIQGAITKRIVRDDGICLPMIIDGGVKAPKQKANDCKWMQFQTIDQMVLHFENEPFDELAARFCVIRNQK